MPTVKFSSPKPVLENFQGLPTLWLIAFQAEKEEIRAAARDFLVSVVDMLCNKHKSRRREITEKKCWKLRWTQRFAGRTDPKKVGTALRIIDGIIEKYYY